MSVLITVKIYGDADAFRRAVVENADELAQVGERARANGAIHHRFGAGDGFVLAVDEWESPAHFEKFFSAPEMSAFIGRMGGNPGVAPEITVTEAIETSDEF